MFDIPDDPVFMATRCISFDVLEDEEVESAETFTISSRWTDATWTVTILDNDGTLRVKINGYAIMYFAHDKPIVMESYYFHRSLGGSGVFFRADIGGRFWYHFYSDVVL